MSKLKFLLFCGLILGVLSACGQKPSLPGSQDIAPAAVSVAEVAPTAAGSQQPVSLTENAQAEPDYCLECHIDQQKLKDTANPDPEVIRKSLGVSMVGEVTAQPVWERVLVDNLIFPKSIHGLNGCTSCHGGVQSPEKDAAHTGMIRNPSRDPEAVCGQCHPDIVTYFPNNLHSNNAGYWAMISKRGSPSTHPVLKEAMQEQCSSCHATCGECHVSKPNVVGGGFVNGHLFNREPSVAENCTACHGTRVGDEYFGNHEGLSADVHFSQGELDCIYCHSPHELHGKPAECRNCHTGPESAVLQPSNHRYGGIQWPRCESCHPDVVTGQDEVLMHQQHGGDLSCQVCHSIEYTSCDGCHVGVDSTTGEPTNTLDASYLTFLIGRNPLKSYDRPYEFVPLRHIPVDPTTFDYYGKNLLPNFSLLETWKYATPHNIQRQTPQTETCNSCHGNPALFLTADKVDPDELEANRDVIMESIPPIITSVEQLR